MEINVTISENFPSDIQTVYEAIIKKDKLSKYFVSYSSDDIGAGKEIVWRWDDYDAEHIVTIIEVIPASQIKFKWDASGEETIVKIVFHNDKPNRTTVKVIEENWELNERGVRMAMQQNQGWTDFLCSLKAYLMAGINLREGRGKI